MHKLSQDEKPLTTRVPELPTSVSQKAEAMIQESEKEDPNVILQAAIRFLYVALHAGPNVNMWDSNLRGAKENKKGPS